MTVLVGGVGELYQGDLDLGRRAAERLAGEGLGDHVLVEDLHYGAIAVAQRLEEAKPGALVLVGAEARGRPPGTVERRRIAPFVSPVEELRRSVERAGVGYVSIDLVLEVASGFGVLPDRTVVVEVEPAWVEPSEALSPEAELALGAAIDLVRLEVARIPLLELADRVRDLLREGRLERAAALDVVEALLAELEGLDREGRWGAAFRLRDDLELAIAAGQTGEGMSHLDWSQWWGLIEEMDRLQSREGSLP